MPTVSHSWKASVPIRCVGTWPVITTSGIESISASTMPVTALVAPGPEVTSTTPGLAGGAGVALGGVGRALLVAHQDVVQPRLVEQRVVDRQHRAAGIAEQVGDALVDQGADHDLGAGHDLGGGWLWFRLWDGRSWGGSDAGVRDKKKGPRGALDMRPNAKPEGFTPPPRSAAQ